MSNIAEYNIDSGPKQPNALKARKRMIERTKAASRNDGEVKHLSDATCRERMEKSREAAKINLEVKKKEKLKDIVGMVLDDLEDMAKWEESKALELRRINDGDTELLKEHVINSAYIKGLGKPCLGDYINQVVEELFKDTRISSNIAHPGAIRFISNDQKAAQPLEPQPENEASKLQRLFNECRGAVVKILPEVKRIQDIYIFDETEAERLGGIDGQCNKILGAILIGICKTIMYGDDEYLIMVLLHEMAHTREPEHNKEFHALLDRLIEAYNRGHGANIKNDYCGLNHRNDSRGKEH